MFRKLLSKNKYALFNYIKSRLKCQEIMKKSQDNNRQHQEVDSHLPEEIKKLDGIERSIKQINYKRKHHGVSHY